jgi:hypothetical protein
MVPSKVHLAPNPEDEGSGTLGEHAHVQQHAADVRMFDDRHGSRRI